MDRKTVLVIIIVAILMYKELNHEGLELSFRPDPPILRSAVLRDMRIKDADIHSHKETSETLGRQIGRDAVEKAETTGKMRPFVTPMDGNELRRYRPDARAYYYSQGEQQTPFPMRFLQAPSSN